MLKYAYFYLTSIELFSLNIAQPTSNQLILFKKTSSEIFSKKTIRKTDKWRHHPRYKEKRTFVRLRHVRTLFILCYFSMLYEIVLLSHKKDRLAVFIKKSRKQLKNSETSF